MSDGLYPDLPSERAYLAYSLRCREQMIRRLRVLDPASSADEITKEYIEVTVAEALEDLETPGAGEFFGRITDEHAQPWYIGRRHVETEEHDPVVVDWRAPIAAPFYRATGVDPLGLRHRRRYLLDAGGIDGYLDEQLDDPDSARTSGGIPDPVLAEIGAERTGQMREIVSTIQREQDEVIRAPIDQCLVVQGGPGTGKTAVGLHRAAYLLFEHRRRLLRDGVLVVGPNPVFLEYIANVLPSLGERSVRQATVLDLCVPKVSISAADDTEAAAWKGAPERLDELESALAAGVGRASADLRCPVGARTLVITAADVNGWIEMALDGKLPINRRRESLRGIVTRALQQRTDRDDLWTQLPDLRAALSAAWPTQKPAKVVDRMLPGRSGSRRAWTPADQLLVDEANSLLNGTPFTYGHVVVDEAQDHSAVGLRVIGRRSPKGSMTVLGDLAQSSTPAGQQHWAAALEHLGVGTSTVAELTIGYRVPAPILDIANRLLPLTGVAATPSRSVRHVGEVPTGRVAAPGRLVVDVVDEVVRLRHRHRNAGVVAEARLLDALREGLPDDVPVFTPEAVKGLEFDAVVVVNAHELLDGSERGARLLYVAMTRAVQVLSFVGEQPLPALLSDRAGARQ
jgi:DNA helicase IV